MFVKNETCTFWKSLSLPRIHGLMEVSSFAYESCDTSEQHHHLWSPGQLGGDVIVWLDPGRSHYFIDPVVDKCLDNVKTKVTF